MTNQQLIAALANPNLATMSDADAAEALNVPTFTPRIDPITLTTLSGASVWGFVKTAAFRSALEAVANSSNDGASLAATLLSILEGPGFFATDPQVAAMVPTFVALGNGTVTNDDANLALGTPTYPAGGPVATADVTAARAAMAYTASMQALYTASDAAFAPVQTTWSAANDLRNRQYLALDAIVAANGSVPENLGALGIS